LFDQNALKTKGEISGKPEGQQPADAPLGNKAGARYSRGSGKNYADDFSKAEAYSPFQGQGQPGGQLAGQQGGKEGAAQNPQLANEQQKQQLQKELEKAQDEVRDVQSARSQAEQQSLSRYGMNLDQNTQQQEAGGLALNLPNVPPGQPMAPGGGPASGSGQAMGGMGGFGGGMGAGGAARGDGLHNEYRARGYGTSDGGAQHGGGMLGGLQPATGAAPGSTTPAPAPMPAAPVVPSGDTYANVAAGLASLDFRLPERGRVYSFTTQRGLIDISARPVSLELLQRLGGLAVLAAVVLIVWAATRAPARAVYARLFSTVASGVLLAVLGLLSLITGIFPVLGLVLLVAGIVLAIRNRSVPAAVAAR
jgi:hypothetical protein